MVAQLCSLLEKYDLMHHMIKFVKNKGINLISMATTLCFVVDCRLLKLQQVYEGTCFSHIMSKACQYGNNDEKVTTCLK